MKYSNRISSITGHLMAKLRSSLRRTTMALCVDDAANRPLFPGIDPVDCDQEKKARRRFESGTNSGVEIRVKDRILIAYKSEISKLHFGSRDVEFIAV